MPFLLSWFVFCVQEDDSDIEVDLDPVPSVSPAVAESISSFVKVTL